MKTNNGKAFSYPDGFERFWAEYPRKMKKYAAFRAYQVCRSSGHCDGDLIAAARNYAVCCEEDNTGVEYIMYPSQFLKTVLPALSALKMKWYVENNRAYCNQDICSHCLYIGGGESICDLRIETVMEDWVPTKENAGNNCPYSRNT